MPVHKEGSGFQWGGHGKIYPTKAQAEKQAAAAHANGFQGDASMALKVGSKVKSPRGGEGKVVELGTDPTRAMVKVQWTSGSLAGKTTWTEVSVLTGDSSLGEAFHTFMNAGKDGTVCAMDRVRDAMDRIRGTKDASEAEKLFKKGDKIRENRMGARVETVMSANGPVVETYEGNRYHPTKIVKASAGDRVRDAMIKITGTKDAPDFQKGDKVEYGGKKWIVHGFQGANELILREADKYNPGYYTAFKNRCTKIGGTKDMQHYNVTKSQFMKALAASGKNINSPDRKPVVDLFEWDLKDGQKAGAGYRRGVPMNSPASEENLNKFFLSYDPSTKR